MVPGSSSSSCSATRTTRSGSGMLASLGAPGTVYVAPKLRRRRSPRPQRGKPLFEPGDAEHARVPRTGRRPRYLASRNARHLDGAAAELGDVGRELGIRTRALVDHVVRAVTAAAEKRREGRRQIGGEGRRAALVVHRPHGFALVDQARHLRDEVLPAVAVDPRAAHDVVPGTSTPDEVLTGELGAS